MNHEPQPSLDTISGNVATLTTRPLRSIKQLPSFLLVLYLSLPTFHFRGRKNEYSARRGWRPLANRYHSRNHKIYRENSKSRNEAPDVEVWIRKLRQNTTSRTVLRDVNTSTYEEKNSYKASCRIRTDNVLVGFFKRYWCAAHSIEIST